MIARADVAARLALAVLLAAALLPGCEVHSRLAPAEPIADLDDAESAQLCRFTSDVLVMAPWECTGEPPPPRQTEHEACLADPPWAGFRDVGDWEDCVRARLRDPCDTGEGCVPEVPDE